MRGGVIGFICLVVVSSAFGLTPNEKEVVQQMRDTINLLRAKLETAQNANESALAALALATHQTAELVNQSAQAAERAAKLVAERDMVTAELSVAEAKAADLNKKYQRAQLIIAIAAAVVAGLLAVQFSHNLQPPYGILVPVAAGAAAFFCVYILI